MSAKCPHCSTAIESLPGFVPQETLEQRLKSQKEGLTTEAAAIRAERDTLKTALAEVQSKASSYDAVVAERDKYAGEVKAIQQRGERSTALAKHKVSDAMLPHFEQVYGWATAGQEKPPTFAEWLDAAENGAKSHPLLTPHFGAAPAGQQAPAQQPAPNKLGDPAAGQPRPAAPPGGKVTPRDVIEYFQSAEYRALPPEKQAEAMRQKQAEVAAQTANPGL